MSLLLAMVLLSLSSLSKADNLIELDQGSYQGHTGDNLNLLILQTGADNIIRKYQNSYGSWITGDDVSIHLEQMNESGTDNIIDIWHLEGDDNEVRWGQGLQLSGPTDTTFSFDGSEGGGHYARLDIHGDNNTFIGSQKMDTNSISHSITANIYSDNNDVYVRQAQNGNKTFTLTIRNSNGNDVFVNQRDNGAHTATVSLLGTQPTDLDLIQKGNTTQSYSLSQNCVTVGGCSVTGTQE